MDIFSNLRIWSHYGSIHRNPKPSGAFARSVQMRRHIVNLTEGNTSAKKYRYCDRMEGFQVFPFSGSFADAFGGFGDIPNTTASPNVDSMRLYETLGVCAIDVYK